MDTPQNYKGSYPLIRSPHEWGPPTSDNRNLKMVQQALNYGADKDLAPHEHNLSPLEFAALNSQHAIMKVLLERKALIIMADTMTQSALLHLVQSGDTKGVRIFLKTRPKNKDRHAVVSQALLVAAAKVLAQHSAASLDIVRSLVAAGARSPSDVERAIQHGQVQALKELLRYGAPLVNTMQALSPLQLAQTYAQKKARTLMAPAYQHILRIIQDQTSCTQLLGVK